MLLARNASVAMDNSNLPPILQKYTNTHGRPKVALFTPRQTLRQHPAQRRVCIGEDER